MPLGNFYHGKNVSDKTRLAGPTTPKKSRGAKKNYVVKMERTSELVKDPSLRGKISLENF